MRYAPERHRSRQTFVVMVASRVQTIRGTMHLEEHLRSHILGERTVAEQSPGESEHQIEIAVVELPHRLRLAGADALEHRHVGRRPRPGRRGGHWTFYGRNRRL